MTTTGFVFLSRKDPGKLWLSHMFGSNQSLAGFSYVVPQSITMGNYTVSHFLYWYTSLMEREGPEVEETLRQNIELVTAQKTVTYSQTSASFAAPTAYLELSTNRTATAKLAMSFTTCR